MTSEYVLYVKKFFDTSQAVNKVHFSAAISPRKREIYTSEGNRSKIQDTHETRNTLQH